MVQRRYCASGETGNRLYGTSATEPQASRPFGNDPARGLRHAARSSGEAPLSLVRRPQGRRFRLGSATPVAVKTKPYGAENGSRVVAGAPARTTSRFPVLTADPRSLPRG